MKLKTLCQAAGIVCRKEYEEIEITAVATDSEKVEGGGMFVCLVGVHTDGHCYIARAIEKGAKVILVQKNAEITVDRTLFPDVIFLSANDTKSATAFLFHAWYGSPGRRAKLIAVTGTNGKTTLTFLLRHLFVRAGYRCGIIGTLGCFCDGKSMESRTGNPLANMTTPDPAELYRILAEMEKSGVDYVFMEASSHALALEKLAPLRFSAAIFTNLTPEHLDFHRNMEDYANAKQKLFAMTERAVINLDSPYADRMKQNCKNRIVTCSMLGKKADYSAKKMQNETLFGEHYGMEKSEKSAFPNGVAFDLQSDGKSVKIFFPGFGDYSVMNALEASAVALEEGIDPETVREALADFPGVKGRMEQVVFFPAADFSAILDYAHTPDALEKLLQTVRGLHPAGKIILVFGCGGERDHAKRPLMGRIAERYADRVIVTSDNPRRENPTEIIREILSGMENAVPLVIENRREAIRQAVFQANPGDVILLAGKGHEEYELVGTEKRPFSERQILQDAYNRKRIGPDPCSEKKKNGSEEERS